MIGDFGTSPLAFDSHYQLPITNYPIPMQLLHS